VNFTVTVVRVSNLGVVDRLHRAADFADFHLLLRQNRVLSQNQQILFGPLEAVDFIRESLTLLNLALLSQVLYEPTKLPKIQPQTTRAVS